MGDDSTYFEGRYMRESLIWIHRSPTSLINKVTIELVARSDTRTSTSLGTLTQAVRVETGPQKKRREGTNSP